MDFSNSHHISNRERAEDQMGSYLQAIEVKKTPMLAMQRQMQFLNPAPSYRPRLMMRVTMTLERSKANQRYLGKYLEFFDDEIEQPVLT